MASILASVGRHLDESNLKKVKSDKDASTLARATCVGKENIKFMLNMINDPEIALSKEEMVIASNQTILGGKIARKIGQGYQAKGMLAKCFNTIANSCKDISLEVQAGNIVSGSYQNLQY